MQKLLRLLAATLMVLSAIPAGVRGDESAADSTKHRKLGPLFSHELLDKALQQHVKEGGVNYAALKQDKNFESYIESLTDAQPETFLSDEQRLAFWINVFNACVIKGVIDRYPVKSVKSIHGFWTAKGHNVAGVNYSLNAIEGLVKKYAPEPRAVFALCRGSVDGPKAPDRSYNTWDLDDRLEKVTNEFLNGKDSRNFLVDRMARKVKISRVFEWWSEVFEQKGGLAEFLFRNLRPQVNAKFMVHEHYTTDYFEWNWKLNDAKNDR